ENVTFLPPYDVRSGDMWSERMEIWNRPGARTGFRYAETNAQADSSRANKVHLIPAIRGARSALERGRPSILLARKSNPIRPRAGRTAHRPELHQDLRRLLRARSQAVSLAQILQHQCRSIFQSPTRPIFCARSRDARPVARWHDCK